MHISKAAQLARRKMDENKLMHWTFKMNGRLKRTFGLCRYNVCTIELSRDYVEANDEASVLDTILHEIAHALTPGALHGRDWQAMCRILGCKPEQYVNPKNIKINYKWQMALMLPCGNLERLQIFGHKKTNLVRRQLKLRPDSYNRLSWLPTLEVGV